MKTFLKTAAMAMSALAFAASANAETTLLSADAMVDVETGGLMQGVGVLIEDGKIVSVGQLAAMTVPEGTETIDLSGYTIMPGMIDMHVHLMGNTENHGYAALGVSSHSDTIYGVVNAETTLMSGYTTVRNVGAGSFSDVALRDAIAEGAVPGPRMFVAGPAIGITGGHCSDNNLLPPEYKATGEGVADGPWAVRAKVRQNIKYGADLIKTCSTGGVLSKGTKVGAPQYTVEELTALVEEAHSHGLKVASHAHGAEGIYNALVAGVDTIEHASFIDEKGIALAKEKGAYLSMDIYVTEYILGEGEAAGILEESLAKERMTGHVQRTNFTKAHEAGVKMVFGTDAGVYPHGQNARQLSRMVQFGMSPLEALQATTINASTALGKNDTIGSVAPGYFADIIAVKGNPLDDVSILENVDFVMKEGVVYKSPE